MECPPVLPDINRDHTRRHHRCNIDRHNPTSGGRQEDRRVNAKSSKESDGSLLTPPEMFGKRTASGHISQMSFRLTCTKTEHQEAVLSVEQPRQVVAPVSSSGLRRRSGRGVGRGRRG
jgi:hypothetical protein